MVNSHTIKARRLLQFALNCIYPNNLKSVKRVLSINFRFNNYARKESQFLQVNEVVLDPMLQELQPLSFPKYR